MDLSKSRYSPGLPVIMNTLAECIVFGFKCVVYLEKSVVVRVTSLPVINSTSGSLLLTDHAVPKYTHTFFGTEVWCLNLFWGQ